MLNISGGFRSGARLKERERQSDGGLDPREAVARFRRKVNAVEMQRADCPDLVLAAEGKMLTSSLIL